MKETEIVVCELPPPPTVSKETIAARLEVTESMIDNYMKRYWTRGVHYTVKAGRARFKWKEIDAWSIDDGQPESGPEGEACQLKSGEVSAGSSKKSLRAIHSATLPLPPQLSDARIS